LNKNTQRFMLSLGKMIVGFSMHIQCELSKFILDSRYKTLHKTVHHSIKIQNHIETDIIGYNRLIFVDDVLEN
jgi:hypothetical protein